MVRAAPQQPRNTPTERCVREEPEESAKAAGLRYVSDARQGIRRAPAAAGDGFDYFAADGSRITDARVLERISALAIPPAWTRVWICPTPRGHIQATGKDARGRKQYRYHASWQAIRAETKFSRTVAFGEALPTIRASVERDLTRPGLSREKVLATIVRLLDETAIRIGNEAYVKENASYGLTTLRNRHVQVNGGGVRFRFRGKSGKQHQIALYDRRVARVLRQLQDLPGQHLFEYVDEAGEIRTVESSDVNDYLRALTGEPFSAKDFRTWEATVRVAAQLWRAGRAETKAAIKQAEKAAIAEAAQHLGNTCTICKTSYVHPAILAGYRDGTLLAAAPASGPASGSPVADPAPRSGLDPEEVAVLGFLRAVQQREAMYGARAS